MVQRVSVELSVVDNLLKNTEGISRQFAAQLKRMEDSVNRLDNTAKASTSVSNSLRTAYAGIAAVAGGMVAREIFKAGAQVENLTTQFSVLLGSTDAAKARLKGLAEFAAVTPFGLGEVAEASRTLEIFTKGAFSTGDALRKIGDAASGSGQGFKEAAFWIGRLYAGMQQGTAIGQETMRLTEMSIISGEARRKIEALTASGAPLAEKLKVLDQEFARFNGSMEAMSRTVSGRASTAMDNLQESIRQVLAGGAWENLNAALADFNTGIERAIKSGAMKEFGEHIVTAATVGRDFFIVWGGGKVAMLAIEMGRLAVSAKAWGVAMAWANANPAMIALGAGMVAYEATTFAMKKMNKEAELGNTEWMRTAGNVDKARGMLAEYDKAQANLRASVKFLPGTMLPTREFQEADKAVRAIDRSFKELTSKSIKEARAAGIDLAMNFRIMEDMKMPDLNKPKVDEEVKPSEDSASTRLLSKADAARIAGQGQVIDMLEVSHKALIRHADVNAMIAEHDIQVQEDKKKATEDWLKAELDALDQIGQAELNAQQQRNNIANTRMAADQAEIEMAAWKGSAIVGSMQNIANAAGAFAGKSKAMFAILQSLALAEATVNMWRAVMFSNSNPATLWKVPYDYALGGTAIAAILAQTVAGFEVGGYTGPGNPKAVAGLVHRNEYVVPSPTVNRMGGPAGVENALAGRTSGEGSRFNLGGISIVIQGNADRETVDAIGENIDARMRKAWDEQEEMKYRNRRARRG